jgi:hypothetical protein
VFTEHSMEGAVLGAPPKVGARRTPARAVG